MVQFSPEVAAGIIRAASLIGAGAALIGGLGGEPEWVLQLEKRLRRLDGSRKPGAR